MKQDSKPEAFRIFDEWILRRGYKWNSKLSKKELWKMFVAECNQCGIVNVFKCKDYNALKKLLGLKWTDEDGREHDGFFITEDFEWKK